MRLVLVVGLLFTLLGILALVHPGIPYKARQDIVRVGPVREVVQTQTMLVVPRALSAVVLAGGVVLLALSLRLKK